MKKTTMFRQLLANEKMIVAPGAYDCLSAVILQDLGYKAIFASGFCLNASVRGVPDTGTESRTDVVTQARNLAAAVDIPVFVDAADGYGGPASIFQTIRELEKAGAAGCFIEDQTRPQICPYIGRPPTVVPVETFLPKLRAALDAREDKDFVIMARTDAGATMGVEESIRRARIYRDAGADLIAPCGGTPKDKEGLKKFTKAIGAPLMVQPAFESGMRVKDYEEIGIKLLVGIESVFAAAKAVRDIFLELKTTGYIKEEYTHLTAFPEFARSLKIDKWSELEKKYQA
jgi:2,3-dimethylmalate lyase